MLISKNIYLVQFVQMDAQLIHNFLLKHYFVGKYMITNFKNFSREQFQKFQKHN